MQNLVNDIIMSIILNAIKNNDINLLESLGVPSDSIESLKQIDKNILINLNENNSLIKVSIDISALNSIAHKSRSTSKYNEQLKEAIRQGATRDIMHRYASLSHTDFKKIRQTLGLNPKRSGTSMTYEESKKLDDVIIAALKNTNNNKINLTLEKLIKLSKKSDQPINAIYPHIIEFWGNKFTLK